MGGLIVTAIAVLMVLRLRWVTHEEHPILVAAVPLVICLILLSYLWSIK